MVAVKAVERRRNVTAGRIMGTVNSLQVGLFIRFINSGPNAVSVTLALELDLLCLNSSQDTYMINCVIFDKLLNLSDPCCPH